MLALISVITASVSAATAVAALRDQNEREERRQAEQLVIVDFAFPSPPDFRLLIDSNPRIQNFSRLPIEGISLYVKQEIRLEDGSGEDGQNAGGDGILASFATEYEVGLLESCQQIDVSDIIISFGDVLREEWRRSGYDGSGDYSVIDIAHSLRYVDASGETWYRSLLSPPTKDATYDVVVDYSRTPIFHTLSAEPIPNCAPS